MSVNVAVVELDFAGSDCVVDTAWGFTRKKINANHDHNNYDNYEWSHSFSNYRSHHTNHARYHPF